MSTRDWVAVIQAFDAAWNAHDLNAVMGYFDDAAIIQLAPPPPDGGIYSGKPQIQAWVEGLLPGFHVDSSDHCVTGDEITWRFRVTADTFRGLSADPVEGTAGARFVGDKIRSLTLTFDSATAARLQSA